MTRASIYLHSSENMKEIKDNSVDLLIGASVFIADEKGKCANWGKYEKLYEKVYVEEGKRILKKTGTLLIVQTNSYSKGRFICKYIPIVKLLERNNFTLIDERVWKRCKANNFQVPFSHVLVFVPPNGTRKRGDYNKKSKKWFQGVWEFPQNKSVKAELNAWPVEMAKTVIEACTHEEELIVDPFAGTGIVLSTAHFMNRRGIGYEIDEKLVPVIQKYGCDVIKNGKILKREKLL